MLWSRTTLFLFCKILLYVHVGKKIVQSDYGHRHECLVMFSLIPVSSAIQGEMWQTFWPSSEGGFFVNFTCLWPTRTYNVMYKYTVTIIIIIGKPTITVPLVIDNLKLFILPENFKTLTKDSQIHINLVVYLVILFVK